MKVTNIKLLLENCLVQQDIFLNDPAGFFSLLRENFDPLFSECDKLKVEIFKSSLAEFFNALEDLDDALKRLSFTDPDILEEAKLFISGGFGDLNSYLKDLESSPDSKELKDKNSQKLDLLKGWVQELRLSLPTLQEKSPENLTFERFIIFEVKGDYFGISESLVQEILHIQENELKPIEDHYFSSIISHRGQKILTWDRKLLLGEEYDIHPEGTRIFLMGERLDALLAFQVDKIIKIEELETSHFTNIEDITGPHYFGAVQFVTLYEGDPIFIFGKRNKEWLKTIIPYQLLR